LITASFDLHVKIISVENKQVFKEFGQVCDSYITAMKITADGEKLFVGDHSGSLQLISSRNGELIKHFEQAHGFGQAFGFGITGIVITPDQNFFFTSSFDVVLKQWNYEDNTLARNYGNITDGIFSLCL
jgi:WD40 repeat protein